MATLLPPPFATSTGIEKASIISCKRSGFLWNNAKSVDDLMISDRRQISARQFQLWILLHTSTLNTSIDSNASIDVCFLVISEVYIRINSETPSPSCARDAKVLKLFELVSCLSTWRTHKPFTSHTERGTDSSEKHCAGKAKQLEVCACGEINFARLSCSTFPNE